MRILPGVGSFALHLTMSRSVFDPHEQGARLDQHRKLRAAATMNITLLRLDSASGCAVFALLLDYRSFCTYTQALLISVVTTA